MKRRKIILSNKDTRIGEYLSDKKNSCDAAIEKYTETKSTYRFCIPVLLISILLIGNACVKSNDGLIEDPSTNRPFVPYSFSVKTTKDSAIFSWSTPVLSAGKKYSYTVDVSQDSLFNKIDFTKTVDSLGFVVLDPTLSIGKRYFARLQVNAYNGSQPSRYDYITKSFSIPGLNYLRILRDFEITSTSVLLHWFVNEATAGITKITLSVDTTIVKSFDVTSSDIAAGEKLLSGLTPGTKYTLQVLAGGKSYGIVNFSTPNVLNFKTILSSGGDLAGVIAAAANGDVIGLDPGEYSLASVTTMTGKHITIASTSNNPADTRIKVRELDLLGDSSGITLSGLNLDGHYNDASYGVQFMTIKGATADGDPAAFSDIKIDNCIIHDFTRCFLIANKSSTPNIQTINSFTINNSIVYNIDSVGTSTYYTFSTENLQFNSFNITKSTFYNMGVGMFNMSKTLIATSMPPAINISACTFNNWGGGNKYLFIDANNNKIAYTFQNSIIANTPQAGAVNGTAFRCTGAGSVLDFLNNDYFNLYSTAGSTTPLILTGLNQVSCLSIGLGWSPATRNFSLANLPADNQVLTMSTSGGTVGDPRWAY